MNTHPFPALVISIAVFCSVSVLAKPYLPDNQDAALLVVPELAVKSATLEDIRTLIDKAQRPSGTVDGFSLADALMQPHLTAGSAPEALYLWARIQQHQHDFRGAELTLRRLLEQQPDDASARLLLASVQTIQGKFGQARQSCLQLIGRSSMLVTAACALDNSFQQAKTREKRVQSYSELQSIATRYPPQQQEDSVWLMQILAGMALALDRPEAALAHLSLPADSQRPISYLSLWADAQLAQDNPQAVLTTLADIASRSGATDDNLLLKLALAEQMTGTFQHWQVRCLNRITLREQRQDASHAGLLASYYLLLGDRPDRALFWARINWQQNRLLSDRQLLLRAEQAFNQQV
ncbi:tetratricopeptide repeat protein [Photobacterium sp. WH24]|uniref:tetratricopeptide repeat protein n=1 Tax=Photobacterium sp. WH24 TaxID=2827237 RepID=UPI001C472B47|nr:tetratricopeptide repeat protein [Photobacterium sp. WH24]MBV7263641.1 tetratricopeptide repeat protein [Photobacterium sp. WH24]